jgi:archaellum component FlaC
MGLLKLFNKKEDAPQGQDLNALKERFNQLQGVGAPSSSDESQKAPDSKPSQLDPQKQQTVNVVELEGTKESEQTVPLGQIPEDDSDFEEVILSQDTTEDIEKQKHEEEINKRSIASYLDEIKENYEDAKLISLVIKQVKELIEIDNSLNQKITEIEATIRNEISEREKLAKSLESTKKEIKGLEKNMEKFIALYELVTNQFNPFIEKNAEQPNLPTTDSAKAIPSLAIPESSSEPDDSESESNEDDAAPAASAAQELFRKLKKQKKPSDIKEVKQGSESSDSGNSGGQAAAIIKQLQEQAAQGQDTGTSQAPAATDVKPSSEQTQPVAEQPPQTAPVQPISPSAIEPLPAAPVQGQQPSAIPAQGQQAGQEPKDPNCPTITQKQTKKLPEHLHFVLKNGTRIDSLSGLLKFFQENDDITIGEYVTHYKNEFAGWIYETFHNDSLSENLASCKTRLELIKALSDYIEKNH